MVKKNTTSYFFAYWVKVILMLSGFSENENEPLSSSDFDFASIVVEDISKDFWKNPSISDSSKMEVLNTFY